MQGAGWLKAFLRLFYASPHPASRILNPHPDFRVGTLALAIAPRIFVSAWTFCSL